MTASDVPTPLPPKRSARSLVLIGGATGLIVLCLCVCATSALLWFDPFGWGLVARLFGGGDPLASAVPASSSMYLSLDLAKFTSPEMSRLIQAFATASGEEDMASGDDLFDRLSTGEDGGLGLTMQDDIVPWIGQYVSFAATNVTWDPVGEQQIDFVLLAEVRNRTEADAFIERFTAAVAARDGTPFTSEAYRDVSLQVAAQGDGTSLVVTRSGGVLMLGNTTSAVQAALDAQSGDSERLGRMEAFRQLQAELPRERLLTIFISGDELRELASAGGAVSPMATPNLSNLEAIGSMAMTLAAVEQGLQMDAVVQFNPELLPESQRVVLEAEGGAAVAERLPANTLAYVTGYRPDLAWQGFRDSMDPALRGDFDESLGVFEEQFGFELGADLLQHLDGYYGVAILSDPDSFFSQMELGDIGYTLVAQSSNTDAVVNTLGSLGAPLEEMGIGQASRQEMEGIVYYELVPLGATFPLAVYGGGDGWVTIASSSKVFAGVYSPGNALADQTAYQAAWAGMPTGLNPVAYLDIVGLLNLIEKTEVDIATETNVLRAISAVVVGNGRLNDDLQRVTALLVVP